MRHQQRPRAAHSTTPDLRACSAAPFGRATVRDSVRLAAARRSCSNSVRWRWARPRGSSAGLRGLSFVTAPELWPLREIERAGRLLSSGWWRREPLSHRATADDHRRCTGACWAVEGRACGGGPRRHAVGAPSAAARAAPHIGYGADAHPFTTTLSRLARHMRCSLCWAHKHCCALSSILWSTWIGSYLACASASASQQPRAREPAYTQLHSGSPCTHAAARPPLYDKLHGSTVGLNLARFEGDYI